MYQAIIIVHVLIAISIIALVLLQQGRGAEAGAAFGGGASGTVFGARGAASFLTRTTAVLATLFFGSSLVLAYLSDTGSEQIDIMDVPEVEVILPSGDLPSVQIEEAIQETFELSSDLPSMSIPEETQNIEIDEGGINFDDSSTGDSTRESLPAVPEDLP